MAELGVGQQHPVVNHRGTDPGSEGQQHHYALAVTSGSVVLLGETGCVGIVEDRHRPAVQSPAVLLGRVGAYPGSVNVRRGVHDTVDHHTGVRDSEWPGEVEVPNHFCNRGRHRLRCRRLGRVETESLTDDLAGGQVDDGPLDPAAPDVDAEGLAGEGGFGHCWSPWAAGGAAPTRPNTSG